MPEKLEAILRGVSFRPLEAKEIVRKLQSEETSPGLILQREPDNGFDSNAIKVLHEDSEIHIGYVAKEVAAELAPMMDEGRQFTCTISMWMRDMMPVLEIEEIVRADDPRDSVYGESSAE